MYPTAASLVEAIEQALPEPTGGATNGARPVSHANPKATNPTTCGNSSTITIQISVRRPPKRNETSAKPSRCTSRAMIDDSATDHILREDP